MRNFLVFSLLLISLGSCISTRSVAEKSEPLIGATVKQWMDTHTISSSEKLAIIVKSEKALKGYHFLKLIKNNFYGGLATYVQMQILFKDPDVLRVYAGTQKTH